ncbi:MAG: glycosyltransferase family 4 protein [Gammaproteobacteria bacterium]|nr:glycosyltransferase family 4 protein [Gammaproteobacteria bacterium]
MSKVPTHICHLFASQVFGGLEKHVLEQCRWQRANTDAKIAVIAHPRYRTMFEQEVTFLPLNTDRSRHNVLLYIDLLRTIRCNRFDLVHAHGGKPAQLLRRLKFFLHSQLIITRHNIKYPSDDVSRYFPNRIAVSKLAIKYSSLAWEVIPNGTEVTSLTRARPEALMPDRRAVLAVARLVPAKGLDRLLQAWKLAKTGDAILYLIGDGPELRALQTLAERLNIIRSVRFVGFTSQVLNWYVNADLMVMSSRNEGAPYTIVEALLSECPVISTDVGNVSENIPPEYVAADGNPQTIAKLLTKALAQQQQLRENYQDCFARAKANLTLEAMSRSTWQVYLRAHG